MASSYLPPEVGKSINEIMVPDIRTTVNLFGMHLRRVHSDWEYPEHVHPQYEINYVLDGEQLMTIEGQEYLQCAGDLILLRPGDTHSSRSGNDDPFSYFCIHFDIDDRIFLSVLSRMQQVLFRKDSPVTHQVQPVMSKLIDIISNTENKTMAHRMQLQSTIFELFGHLWDAISNEVIHFSSSAYEKVELAHQIRSRIQALLNQNFKQEGVLEQHYGIDDIAAELGISPSHCNRVFRQVFDLSPRAYLSQLVLHEAKLLLANPRLSIHDIASLLGYRDIAHFSRQFKRWSHVSPSEYRCSSTGIES